MSDTPTTPLFTAAPPLPPSGNATAAVLPRQPVIVWEDLAGWVKAEAEQIQAALLTILLRWDDPHFSHAELEQIGLDAWQRVFGKPISGRHLRRIIRRIVRNDGGRREWTNLALYLRDNPPRRPGSRAELPGDDETFGDVFDKLSGFAIPNAPSPAEKALLWLTAWRWHHGSIQDGAAPKAAKAQLLRFLHKHAPWLSERRNGLRNMVARAFQKLDEQHGDPAAALDGRHAKRGEKRAPAIPEADINKIGGYALFATGKRLAQTERELVEMRDQSGLSAATLNVMDAGQSKSYVNRRLAQSIQPLIKAAAPYLLGKKAVDDATPSLKGNYSKLRSLDMVSADDFTLPVPFPVPDGKGWFKMIVGQCLLFADVRSRKIITRVMVPTPNYDSLDVASGQSTVCLEEGIPGIWQFENGLWKKSNLVKRKPPAGWQDANESEAAVQFGWEKLGVRFRHCRRAKGKAAENIGALLQNFMERCPGYRGRAARYDCPDETKKMLLAVEGKRMHPLEYFWSFDQWLIELDRLIELYNNDRQDGDILDKRTPTEAYQEFWPQCEVTKLDADCWHIVAHYVREMPVTSEGIRFEIGRNSFQYFDEALGPFIHQRVLGWFDPTHPDILGITTLDKRNPVFVQRHIPPDVRAAYSEDPAEREHYQRELAKQAGFTMHARKTFAAFKSQFKRTYRKNIVERQTAALGAELLAKRDDALNKSNVESGRRERILRLARELGQPAATLRDFGAETEQSLKRRLQRRREDDAAPQST